MSVTHDEILLAAVPGEEYTPPSGSHVTGSSIERPRKYWRSHDQNWAVYTVAGNRLGETIIESVKKARGKGLIPLLVVRDNMELAAVAERYGDIECHVACPIGGCGSLISPLNIPHKRTRKKKCSSRIPQDLLGELADSELFPRPIRSTLRHLRKAYEQMPRTGTHDTAEHSALAGFMKEMLHQIGVPTKGRNTIDMIRHLEIAGWGGSSTVTVSS